MSLTDKLGMGQRAGRTFEAGIAVLRERFLNCKDLTNHEYHMVAATYRMELDEEKETSEFLRKALGDATTRGDSWESQCYQAEHELNKIRGHWIWGWFV